jgi:patatin-like phospholipase/acyl hydrolase
MGVFTTSVFASFVADTKLMFVDHFDPIADTSTGGIPAIGLAMGLTTEQLLVAPAT